MTSDPSATGIITRLLEELEVDDSFPAAALVEAQAWAQHDGIDDPALVDLVGVPFVTVDNDGSRDLDQALHVATLGTTDESAGESVPGWRLRYALADAAWYVRPGSALWTEALARGASLYAPDRAIPMLPRHLSEGLVSLGPGVERRALVFDMQVDVDGVVRRTALLRARVRSRLQLTYVGVQRVVDGEIALEAARAAHPASLSVGVDAGERGAIEASLRALRDAGECLQRRQRLRGVVAYDRTESDVRIDTDLSTFDVTPRRRLDSERWNEQLSLACNTEGAALLVALDADDPSIEPIFRVHDAPGSARSRELESTLEELVDTLDLDGAWRRADGVSLAEWFEDLPDDAPRRRRAVQRQILRAQRASNYRPKPGRHHALAAASYARFSSPMREIVGIHTHLACLEAIGLDSAGGTAPTGERLDPAALRDAVIAAAEAARQRQKTLDRGVLFAVIAAVFERDIDGGDAPWRDGTLLGIEENKLHVGLDDMALDVKVYREDVEATTGTGWTFGRVAATPDELSMRSLMLGDGVQVRARDYDAGRRRFVLEVRRMAEQSG